MTRERDILEQLAAAAGVFTSYQDWHGQQRLADNDVLIRVLQLLGSSVERAQDAERALDEHRKNTWTRAVAPCALSWDRGDARVRIQTPSDRADTRYRVQLTLESGELEVYAGQLADTDQTGQAKIDGVAYSRHEVRIPVAAHGYHRARVELGHDDTHANHCVIIAAPTVSYRPAPAKRWGVFAPVYALRRQGGSGAGDLGDLLALAQFARGIDGDGGRGADFVGTLPLLATFLDQPCEPSPYSPVSRLFWNELYLDLMTAPGIDSCAPARQMLSSAAFAEQARALDALALVDYRGQMAHKRAVLELLSDAFWHSDSGRAALTTFMANTPRVDDYARFRAVTEAMGRVWMLWPERQRDGDIRDGDFDDRARRYHIYAQYAAHQQLSRLDGTDAAALYLDVPVGVNRSGYDVWRDRDAFVLPAAVGAPPDALFSSGQNWGLPPMHPMRMRERGYRYVIDTIRHHARHAGLLRIDHVMGLSRLFWIPDGVATKDGVYVAYNADETYAILSLESHRNRCALTGEDLGTVPDYVRPAMARHGLSRLYVAQFSLPDADSSDDPDVRTDITPPPPGSVASLNTHDMPTFDGFWHGRDIDDFHDLGLLNDEQATHARAARAQTRRATIQRLIDRGLVDGAPETALSDDIRPRVLRGLLAVLADSDAELMLVAMEDLWLAPLTHNVPGTTHERPNWQRRMTKRIDEIIDDPEVAALLRVIATRRVSSPTTRGASRTGTTTCAEQY